MTTTSALFDRNFLHLQQQFITLNLTLKIQGDWVRVVGASTPVKEILKSWGFRWNSTDYVWEIAKLILEEKDFTSIQLGPHQQPEKTKRELLEKIQTIKTPFLHQLIDNLLVQGPYKNSFFTAPGAKGIHHAYVGGLAEHTQQVLDAAEKAAEAYPYLQINKDLLITGALLHDIGKIDCYILSSDGIQTSRAHDLFDHIVLGISILGRTAEHLVHSPEDEELYQQLIHIITSHHNLLEWGSPREPKTVEAWLIHIGDLLSSRIAGGYKAK